MKLSEVSVHKFMLIPDPSFFHINISDEYLSSFFLMLLLLLLSKLDKKSVRLALTNEIDILVPGDTKLHFMFHSFVIDFPSIFIWILIYLKKNKTINFFVVLKQMCKNKNREWCVTKENKMEHKVLATHNKSLTVCLVVFVLKIILKIYYINCLLVVKINTVDNGTQTYI